MGSILNEIVPNTGINRSYIQDFSQDLFNLEILKEEAGGYVYNTSGQQIIDQRRGLQYITQAVKPSGGADNTLVLSWERDYTTQQIIVDDEPVYAFTFTDYLYQGYYPLALADKTDRSYYGWFPLEAGTYYFRTRIKTTDIYPTNGDTTVTFNIEGIDVDNINMGTNKTLVSTLGSISITRTASNTAWSYVYGSFTITKDYPLCRITVMPTNSIVYINGITIKKNNSSSALVFNDPYRTIGQLLFEKPSDVGLKVYYRQIIGNTQDPYPFTEVDLGTIDFDSLAINQMTDDGVIGGCYGKELTFTISHGYLYPYTNLFPTPCEIKVTWYCGSVEKVLFDGRLIKEEIDKLFYSTKITCQDSVLYWKNVKENTNGALFPGTGLLTVEEVCEQVWSYNAEGSYKAEGTYKGDWNLYMWGHYPNGARGSDAKDGVYAGDIVSYHNVSMGQVTDIYQYVFPDAYETTGGSFIQSSFAFDGKWYTSDSIKEYIQYMSPPTIVSKTNSSNVIRKVASFKGNWQAGKTYSSGDIVQYGTQKEFCGLYQYNYTGSTVNMERPCIVNALGYALKGITPFNLLSLCRNGDKFVRDVNNYYNSRSNISHIYDEPEYYIGQWTANTQPWKNNIILYGGRLYKYVFPQCEAEDSEYVNNQYVGKSEDECRLYTYDGQNTWTIDGATHKITSWTLMSVLKGQSPSDIMVKQGNYTYIVELEDTYLWGSDFIFHRDSYKVYNGRLYRYYISSLIKDEDYIDIGGDAIPVSSVIFKGTNPLQLSSSSSGSGGAEEYIGDIPFVIPKFPYQGTWGNNYKYTGGSIVKYNNEYYKYKDDLTEVQSYELINWAPDIAIKADAYKNLLSVVTPSNLDLNEYPVITIEYAMKSLMDYIGIPFTYPENGLVNGDMQIFYKGIGNASFGEILKSFCILNGVYALSDGDNNISFKCFWLRGEQGIVKDGSRFYWESPDIVDISAYIDLNNLTLNKEKERVISNVYATYNNTTINATGGDSTDQQVKLAGFMSDFVIGDWNKGEFVSNTLVPTFLLRMVTTDGFHILYKGSIKNRAFLPVELGEVVLGYTTAYTFSPNGSILIMMHVAKNNLSGGNLVNSVINSF